MKSADTQLDVIIVGGGPAGSVLARRLALARARVLLLAGPSSGGCEGISRRTRELLATEAPDATLGLLRGPVPRGGSWGAGRAVTGSEWLVDRSQLAVRLRAAAQDAGAEVMSDLAVGTIPETGGFRVVTRNGSCHLATHLVDARGRRGREQRGPLLLAVGRRFTTPRQDLAPATALHVLADGWCWLVTEPGRAWVQLVGVPRHRPLRDWHANACAELPALRQALAWAEPASPIIARPAHARLGADVSAPGHWRVGDAAYAADPLSGQGIYHALCSARAVASAIGSALNGVEPALAQRFVADLHARMWSRGVSVAADFYREGAAAGPFWTQTAAGYAALAPAIADTPPAIEIRPVLDAGRICARPVLVTSARPHGVWHVDGVALAPLLEYFQASAAADVGGAALALSQPPAAVATATRWLQAAGALPMGD